MKERWKDTWVSIDLDYWCPSSWDGRAKISFKRFLESIPNNIPCHITIQHHEVLRPLRKQIRNNVLSIPFNIVHIDQHHDYYFNNCRGKKIDCGNFMWSVPRKWYKSFKWFQPKYPEESDWERVKNKLKKKRMTSSKKPEINWGRVGLITFTLSPDYCGNLISKSEQMIKAITTKFNIKKTIEKRKTEHSWQDNELSSWGYRLEK